MLPDEKNIHFITDAYKDNSIKCAEGLRRSTSPSKPLLLRGASTKVPKNNEWKSFLLDISNKRNRITFLLTSWEEDSYAPLFGNRDIYFVCEDHCTLLRTPDGLTVESQLQSFLSSQEEADGKIILHCFFAAQTSDELLVRSPDTDVFLLLLHFAEQIKKQLHFETGYGQQHKIIDMTTLSDVHKLESDAILGLHVFTGCDTTSAFLKRGKMKPLKLMRKNPSFREAFQTLDTKITVDPEVLTELEKFVCAMYSKHNYTDVNKLRCDMVNQRFSSGSSHLVSNFDSVDLSLIPSCRTVLKNAYKKSQLPGSFMEKVFRAKPKSTTP